MLLNQHQHWSSVSLTSILCAPLFSSVVSEYVLICGRCVLRFVSQCKVSEFLCWRDSIKTRTNKQKKKHWSFPSVIELPLLDFFYLYTYSSIHLEMIFCSPSAVQRQSPVKYGPGALWWESDQTIRYRFWPILVCTVLPASPILLFLSAVLWVTLTCSL